MASARNNFPPTFSSSSSEVFTQVACGAGLRDRTDVLSQPLPEFGDRGQSRHWTLDVLRNEEIGLQRVRKENWTFLRRHSDRARFRSAVSLRCCVCLFSVHNG